MFIDLITSPVRSSSCPIDSSCVKLVFKNVEENGSITRKSVFDNVDLSGQLSKFHFSDFSLSSILAVGAYDMLKPTYMVLDSGLSAADMVENSLNNIANVSGVQKAQEGNQ